MSYMPRTTSEMIVNFDVQKALQERRAFQDTYKNWWVVIDYNAERTGRLAEWHVNGNNRGMKATFCAECAVVKIPRDKAEVRTTANIYNAVFHQDHSAPMFTHVFFNPMGKVNAEVLKLVRSIRFENLIW